MDNNELQHHGVLGMKWGRRRYQNKDGSLTAAGKKRYNDEMSKLKEEEKTLKNREKTKAMVDKLEAKRRDLDSRKAALKGKKSKGDDDESSENKKLTPEEVAAKKKKILESHSAEEVYKNKDLFSDKEIQDAYNRLNNERNIKGLIPEKVSKGQAFINKFAGVSKNIKTVTDSSYDIYKSVEKGMKMVESISKMMDKTSSKK